MPAEDGEDSVPAWSSEEADHGPGGLSRVISGEEEELSRAGQQDMAEVQLDFQDMEIEFQEVCMSGGGKQHECEGVEKQQPLVVDIFNVIEQSIIEWSMHNAGMIDNYQQVLL